MEEGVKRGDWVVVGGAPNEVAHCTRCGEGLSFGGQSQRMEVFVAATKAFVKAHSNCKPGGYTPEVPRAPWQWAAGRDTGTSSLTIYGALTGTPSPHDRSDVPHDSADFGRCYRLLKLFPEWRNRLGEVAKKHSKWRGLADAWGELETLYEVELQTGKANGLYERIKELTK